MNIVQDDNESKFCIKYSTAVGRYLVADKDLDSHELVIDEKPIVVAPSGYFDIDPDTQRLLPICIECLRSQNIGATNSSFSKCPSCSWPICGVPCVGRHKFHTDEECTLFQENGICQSARSLRMVYLIRCCLMSIHDPHNWEKLSQLAHSVDVLETDKVQDELTHVENGDVNLEMNKQDTIDYKFLTEVCQMRNIDKSLVMKINGVKKVNGFGFSNCPNDQIRYYGIAIYYLSSMASHGCSPNLTTQVSYDPLIGFPMRFRTKTQVIKGQTLEISYRKHWLALGTLRRREKIFQDHKFWCACTRCFDPRENASEFSSVTCTNCRVGSLLPLNPLNPQTPWKCDNENCEYVRDEETISDILERMTDSIERVLDFQVCSLTKFELLSEILRQNLNEPILHLNHYLILRTEVEWIKNFPLQTFHRTEQAWSLFTLLVERAEHCKSIYSKLIPDWIEENYFVDITIGKAYLSYYLTPNEQAEEDNLPFHQDLELDLMKISLKYLQNGLRYAEPEIALLTKSFCKSLKQRIKNLASEIDSFKSTQEHCNECD